MNSTEDFIIENETISRLAAERIVRQHAIPMIEFYDKVGVIPGTDEVNTEKLFAWMGY